MQLTEGYEVKLSQFEGPLDLLLHLVRKAEVDLRDVALSQITDQYMRYMEQVDEIDLDRACAFLETASLLLLIKSRALLPQPPAVQTEDEAEDPEALLLENLRLYEAYKNATGFLQNKQIDGRRLYSKLPEEVEPASTDLVVRGDAKALMKAFMTVLAKRERRMKSPPIMRIEADRWNVDNQKKMIRGFLAKKIDVQFSAFFPPDAPAVQIAVTFSAMLEMWNADEIQVIQKEPFGEIVMKSAETCREAG